MSVDTTVDGVHARLDLGEPAAAAQAFGWRALTTALSDLAAMGVDDALGIEAYVALTLPRDVADDTALALAGGLGDAARRYGVSIVGGDVTAGPVVVMSVTVIGWAAGAGAADVLTRRGARPGDLVGLTGPIGGAGAGLALLLERASPDALHATGALTGDASAHLLRAHLRPEPHLTQGASLRGAGATAAIDLSDGLLQDAGHVAAASGVSLQLDGAAVPIAGGVAEVATALSQDPLGFAARAGEDFVLLTTVPPEHREAAEAAGVIAWIGTAEATPTTPSHAGVAISGLPHDGADLPGGHDHRR